MKTLLSMVLAFLGLFVAHSYGHTFASLFIGMMLGTLFCASLFYVTGTFVGRAEIMANTLRTLQLLDKMLASDCVDAARSLIKKVVEALESSPGVKR